MPPAKTQQQQCLEQGPLLCAARLRPVSPSKMLSSSLQPVVIEMISARCWATMAAVVKPMGVSLKAARRFDQQRRLCVQAFAD